MAAISRDSEGAIVSAEFNYLNDPFNVFFAETAAALMGLRLVQDGQQHNIILETDALQVVNAIHYAEIGRSEAAALISDIKRILPSFGRWKIDQISTEGNQAADNMAKHAQMWKVKSIWIHSLPTFLKRLIPPHELSTV